MKRHREAQRAAKVASNVIARRVQPHTLTLADRLEDRREGAVHAALSEEADHEERRVWPAFFVGEHEQTRGIFEEQPIEVAIDDEADARAVGVAA